MKEIKILLEKLNNLSTDEKVAAPIELDLMLDYTRQLYDQLLSEQRNTLAPKPQETEIIPTLTETTQITRSIGNEEKENIAPEKVIEGSVSPKDLNSTEKPIEGAESKNDTLHTFSSLSFELPHPAEEQPIFPEEGIEEDKLAENDTLINAIPVPPKEDEISDYAKIFNYTSGQHFTPQNDIRKYIGINDKYLFLNELFNSDKKEYETALSKLNEISDYQEALSWIDEMIAPKYKWSKEDETVQDFYALLEKQFLER